jgi:hypothetical protein
MFKLNFGICDILYSGIVAIITLSYFFFKKLNKNVLKEYALSYLWILGLFIGSIVISVFSRSGMIFMLVNFSSNFIIFGIETLLLIYVLYIVNKDSKKYIEKESTIEEESCIKKENSIEEESCKVEGPECNQLCKYCDISPVFLYLITGFLDGFCRSSNFLFVALFIRYKCLFKANLHHMFFLYPIFIILILIIMIMMKGGYENIFGGTKIFFIYGPIVCGLISLIVKNPRYFLIFGICMRIVVAILRVIFWLFPLTAYTLKL